MSLTHTKIRNIKPRNKPFKLSDEKGLFLHVSPNGSKYWCFKYRFGGKEKLLAIGVFSEVLLAEARNNILNIRIILLRKFANH